MALIRNMIDAHAALDTKEGAEPPLPSPVTNIAAVKAAVDTSKKITAHDRARDEIVDAIENGVLSPKTVYGDVFPFPYSAMDGRAYHSQNILTLAMRAHAAGYESGAWMTYAAAEKRGWHPRKGERASRIYLHKAHHVVTDDVDPDTGEPEVKSFPMFRSFAVFNIAQMVKKDGTAVLPEDVAPRRDAVPGGRKPTSEAVALLQRIVEGMGMDIAYDPSAKRTKVEDHVLTVPAEPGDTSTAALSHLARGLIRLSVCEALPNVSAPDPEQVEPLRDAAFNLRVAMAEAMASMHLGFPIEGGKPFDPVDLDRLLAKDKRAARMAAGQAEQAVRYMLSFDPSLRYPLRSEEEQLRDEVLDAVGEDVQFDASEIDFEYVEARTGTRMKP